MAETRCGAPTLTGVAEAPVRWCQLEHDHDSAVHGAMVNGRWQTWPR